MTVYVLIMGLSLTCLSIFIRSILAISLSKILHSYGI